MLRRKVLSLATALVFLITSGVAVAQDATTPPPAAPPAADVVVGDAPAATPADDQEQTEEIVVTGTRIRRKDLTTPAPVTVISRDQIVASGKVSIGDFLQALPEQGNAINTGVNNGGDGATRVNLRGIGTGRTLVLVNGRRWMPGGTGADDSVDLNSIPSAVVERIEVLKDGASAVYGSDAIAGVVNIITRRAGDKSDVSFFTGTSSRGDGETFDVNVTTGAGSNRGNILFSAGYYDQRKVMAGDRDFSRFQWYFDMPAGTAGAPYSQGSGTVPAGITFADPDVTGNTLWDQMMATDEGAFIWEANPTAATACGTSASGQTSCFRPFLGGGLPAAGDVTEGDGYNFAPENYLMTPQQRIQLFSAGDLDLGGVARAFFEAAYVNRQSGQDLAPEPLLLDLEGNGGIPVTADNVYNPFGTDVFVRRRLTEFGRRKTRQDIDTYRVLAGLDGTLPETLGPLTGWFWDVNFNFGRTSAVDTKEGNLFLSALETAVGPSFVDADGLARCGTAAAPIDGCVPLNLFGGPNSITSDQVEGLTFTGTARGTNELKAFQANTSGDLFRLMAETPVGIALGYEYRKLSGSYIFDPITEKGLTTGNKGENTEGSYYVNEVYGELSIPIVSGLPGAEDVEATAAVRLFDYSTFGTDNTYKFGARWRPIRDVTVRGTYSTAFRAPTIGDLYGGQGDNFAAVKDPCRGAAAGGSAPPPACFDPAPHGGLPAGSAGSGDTSSQLRSLVGGNPELEPETADIFTVGLVFEPRWVRNLSVTLDYYNMDIDDNISSFGESVILNGCYSGTNPEYCGLIIRNPTTNFIDRIINLSENVGKLETAGLDLAVRYAMPTTGFGRFGLAFDATWLQKMDQTLADGTVVKGRNTFDLNTLNSFGGSGGSFPEWKYSAGVTWSLGRFGAGVSTRFLGGFHECGEPYDLEEEGEPGFGIPDGGDFAGSGLCYADSTFQRHVSSYHIEDAFVSYTANSRLGRTNLMVGMQNVFDKDPTTIYNGFASQTDQYNYDQMGRFVYVRLAHAY